MKEIKFRVWDADEEKMWDADEIGHFCIDDLCNDLWEDVLQFTGLYDKNGKEIYEGDIIRHKEFYDYCGKHDITKSYVKFEFGGFYPFADNNDYQPYPEPNETEVIGNIYENKELLEET